MKRRGRKGWRSEEWGNREGGGRGTYSVNGDGDEDARRHGFGVRWVWIFFHPEHCVVVPLVFALANA